MVLNNSLWQLWGPCFADTYFLIYMPVTWASKIKHIHSSHEKRAALYELYFYSFFSKFTQYTYNLQLVISQNSDELFSFKPLYMLCSNK